MIVIKRMHEVTLEQAVSVLHQSDHGDFFDMERDIRHFAARFGREGLSPMLSVVAFVHNEPVGLVLSGAREMGGEKVAWISDNVVVPKYRDSRVREEMMAMMLTAFEEEGVTLATLEANSDSERTIQFYHELNFEIVDRLLIMKREGKKLTSPSFDDGQASPFRVIRSVAQDARLFHDIRIMPWQNQWQNLRTDGELLTAIDESGDRVGHMIYKKNYDQNHSLSYLVIHQWRIDEDHPDSDVIFQIIWRSLLDTSSDTTPFIASLLASDWILIERLEAMGFLKTMEHVFMIRRF